jgi:putative ABC transport system substrate-binding protein
VKAAAPAVGRQVLVMSAASEREFEPAFAKLVRPRAGALLVSGSPVFNSQPWQLVALAARQALPAIYDQRD